MDKNNQSITRNRFGGTQLGTSRKPRQIARTRQWIESALIALASEGLYRRTSISALCQKAGVGRPTFYRHFSDKAAVIQSICDRIRNELLQELDECEDEIVSIKTINQYLLRKWKEHNNVLSLMKYEDVRDVLMAEQDRLIREIIEKYHSHTDIDPFVFEFRLWGMKGVLLHWIEQGMEKSPDEINDLLASVSQ